MLVYVVRHGETKWNREGRIQGWADNPLNENGRLVAERTAEILQDVRFDLAYASPLKRAVETARILCRSDSVPVITDERLSEIRWGDWDGLYILKDRFDVPDRATYEMFYTDPLRFPGAPNAESMQNVCRRTQSFWRDLESGRLQGGRTILISTSGCAMRAMLNPLYEHPENFWQHGLPENCEVMILRVENGRSTILDPGRIYYDPSLASNPYKL